MPRSRIRLCLLAHQATCLSSAIQQCRPSGNQRTVCMGRPWVQFKCLFGHTLRLCISPLCSSRFQRLQTPTSKVNRRCPEDIIIYPLVFTTTQRPVNPSFLRIWASSIYRRLLPSNLRWVTPPSTHNSHNIYSQFIRARGSLCHRFRRFHRCHRCHPHRTRVRQATLTPHRGIKTTRSTQRRRESLKTTLRCGRCCANSTQSRAPRLRFPMPKTIT